jgi:hypothetical protein
MSRIMKIVNFDISYTKQIQNFNFKIAKPSIHFWVISAKKEGRIFLNLTEMRESFLRKNG